MKALAALVALALLTAACGGAAEPWPDAERGSFRTECLTNVKALAPGDPTSEFMSEHDIGSENLCDCVLDRLQERFPAAEYTALDRTNRLAADAEETGICLEDLIP